MLLRSITTIASLTVAALLAACGSDTGGAGGEAGGSTTTSTSTTSTTSTTTTDTTSTTTSTSTSTTTTSAEPKCVDLCMTLVACPGSVNADCPKDCEPVETFNTTSKCDDEYQAEVNCVLANPDPCTALENGCKPEATTYTTCRTAYCNANPNTPGCT